jgi:hypothetical protein
MRRQRDDLQMDADELDTAQAEVWLVSTRSQGRVDFARARLTAQFPGLPLPVDPPQAPLPAMPEAGLALLQHQVIERSHEIDAASARVDRVAALADSAARVRIAGGLRVP